MTWLGKTMRKSEEDVRKKWEQCPRKGQTWPWTQGMPITV